MPSNFRSECKNAITGQFKSEWARKTQNANMYPILRKYSKIKRLFGITPYLDTVKNHKYRIAMAQLRTSSHTLAIERGRYARPTMHISDHTCNICGFISQHTTVMNLYKISTHFFLVSASVETSLSTYAAPPP